MRKNKYYDKTLQARSFYKSFRIDSLHLKVYDFRCKEGIYMIHITNHIEKIMSENQGKFFLLIISTILGKIQLNLSYID